MSIDARIAEVSPNHPQFAAAQPDPAVAAAIAQPGLRLPQITQTALEGYADRPALGQRAFELVKDPKTGRTAAELRPWFDTVSYGELAERVDAVARGLADDAVAPGDRVCILGFTSVDYTTIDI